MITLSQPNTRLLAMRRSLKMSRAELARAVRAAGDRIGEPNACSVTTVQRWEQGAEPRGTYLRALEVATGEPTENLGFATERYGVDTRALDNDRELESEPHPQSEIVVLNGIWLSRYEYESSSRNAIFTAAHYVLLLQQDARLLVRSLPGTAPGRLMMDLTVNVLALTGTWTEETNPAGYYRGAVYHGAVQMLLEPSRTRMSGKWVGFGRDLDVNTGPWSLQLVDHDTSPETQETYNRPVSAETDQ